MKKVKLRLMGIAVCLSMLLFIALEKGILPKSKKTPRTYTNKQIVENISGELLRCYTELDLLTKYYLICLDKYKSCKYNKKE